MKKIDKRTKAYRDSQKKLPKGAGHTSYKLNRSATDIQKDPPGIHMAIIMPEKAESLGNKKTHLEMICELQDWCRAQDDRIKELKEQVSNLENKVG